MYQTFESDVMDDLFYESEGLSDMGYADEFDEYDEFDGFDVYDEFEDEFNEYEGFLDEYDELEDYADEAYDEEDLMDAMEEIVADALDADDTDEFLKKLWGGIKKFGKKAIGVARKVGKGIGQVARVAAPILTKIPLPWTQAIGRVAQVAGKLMADGADEFEAIDQLADYTDYDDLDAAIPVIAGLTIRKTMPGIKYKPRSVRKKLVKSVSQATKKVVSRQGIKAAKAMPKVVQTAKKVAQQTGQPLTKAIARTAIKVSKSPATTRRMALPVIKKAKGGMGKLGGCPTCGKKYTLRGPVTISIRGR
jgi:hypothetical protein